MLIFGPVRSTLSEEGLPEVWCAGCGACVAYWADLSLIIVHHSGVACCGLFNTETGFYEEANQPTDDDILSQIQSESAAEMAWLRHAEQPTWAELDCSPF